MEAAILVQFEEMPASVHEVTLTTNAHLGHTRVLEQVTYIDLLV